MNEEFIIRIGANSRAMVTELQRAGSYAKAWGMTLAEDLKGHFGRMLTAGFALVKAEEILDRIKERIIAIHHAQENLGGSSNFIQGVFNWVERAGIPFETIEKPLLKFKQTLDAAKADPASKQAENLMRYGIAIDAATFKNQKFSDSLAKLSEVYLRSGKNLQVLNDLVGKQSLNPALLALLGQGPEAIRNMESGNFFTKLTPSSISQFSEIYKGSKGIGQILASSLGNLLAYNLRLIPGVLIARAAGQFGGYASTGQAGTQFRHPIEALKNIWNGIEDNEERSDEEIAKSIEMDQKKVEINTRLLELKEKQHELESAIADRGKASVAEMASEARKLLGIPVPRNYGVSARMRTALNIDTLERKATLAYERGNDAQFHSLMEQAQALRASSHFLTDKDQNPLRTTEVELARVIDLLGPVEAMARMVNNEHGEGSAPKKYHGAGGSWSNGAGGSW